MKTRISSRLTAVVSRRGRRRSGMTLVWFAMLLTTLLGMVGLVIDAGMLMASHRQVQNAADAAALAAAMDKMYGMADTTATATAITYVKTHNGLTSFQADPVVNIPPAFGAYALANGYVEVIASAPVQTFFIHILPGVSNTHTVKARAVAGYEYVAAGEGVAVLDPYRTGLNVSGTAALRVLGLIIDNSEGRGVDENGNPVGTGENYIAARAGNNSPAYAAKFHIVGGVDWPENFRNVSGEPTNVLFCAQLPIPDPLRFLPTPTVSTGVNPGLRGDIQITKTNFNLGLTPNYETSDPTDPNYITVDPSSAYYELPTAVLHPGIYEQIHITDGKVRFVPGIYVLKPRPNVSSAMSIVGGIVYAQGVMFYSTGNSYSPDSGLPDTNDGDRVPAGYWKQGGVEDDPKSYFGGITINSDVHATPIDTETYAYAEPGIATFNGMLFYQRRRNSEALNIEGKLEVPEAQLSGTLYAKWANININGGGRYDAQFVVGSMYVAGHADLIIDYTGKKLGKAPQVFLVE